MSVLSDAVRRSVGQGAAMLKGEKHLGFRVHARTGRFCPVCGDTVREVSFATSFSTVRARPVARRWPTGVCQWLLK